jgi:hypothetical protein
LSERENEEKDSVNKKRIENEQQMKNAKKKLK